ncbi:MAG: sigma-70 family RNA polymerase sigma factor [Labilithrix sp.]|nr:sigma-70 family RNA polymerase sigma factor [Labilithrix sp.]
MAHDAVLHALFERLLSAHGQGLGRVARVYAGSSADAGDLAQEIAVALWRALPSFRGECSERTFAYRIAHNRGISHLEARRTRENVGPLDEAQQVIDPRPTADAAIDAARRREALWRAIGELPVGSRAVLTLSLEGLPHDEIAEVLGTSANSVAVRLSRARADLREKLQKQEKRHGS